jgi:wobble nucleotide-excising tRNase
MLRKILKIKNVGRFEDCKWRCGSQFESMTLIYGENSRGKSTFCDILRSCQTNSPEFILGRKRLGSTGDCEVEFRTDTTNPNFSKGTWSAILSSLAIFDTTFVHQNVYAGDKIDHDHKKNLYRVVVGEKGVTLARKVDELDVAVRDAGKDVATKRSILEAKLPTGTDLKSFVKLAINSDIANKIQTKTAALKSAEDSIKNAGEIKSKGVLQEIAVPTFASDFELLVAKKLPNVADAAEKQLRAHLATHTKLATESWISQGVSFQLGEICPFCGQDTSKNDLITAYKTFFDAAYTKFKQDLASTEQTVSSTFSDKVTIAAQKSVSNNEVLIEFWQKLGVGTEFKLPDAGRLAETIGAVREAAVSLLKLKIATPLEAVELPDELKKALQVLLEIQAAVPEYNKIVRAFNAKITEYKAKLGTVDVTKIKTELAGLKLVELRGDKDIVQKLADYATAEDAKKKFEKDKNDAKAALDKHDETTLAIHEKRINELLEMFSAGFRIGEVQRSDAGGKPSFNYKLLINKVPVEIGNEKTPLSSPSFRNTLSAGDKSTLALALFISQIEADSQIKDKIIVFDDPFTSQDRSRRTATQSIVCNLAKQVQQVFVLSHDPQFLRAVWDGYKGGGNAKTFQFARMGNNTTIGEWDIERETAGEYVKKHRVLWDYFHHSTGDTRTVAQTIRPVLEEYLRLKLPQSFADNEWLGTFIEKIRNAPDTEPAAAAKCILPDVEFINEYSKRYHHNSNPSASTEIVDETELETYVKKTLDVVGGF